MQSAIATDELTKIPTCSTLAPSPRLDRTGGAVVRAGVELLQIPDARRNQRHIVAYWCRINAEAAAGRSPSPTRITGSLRQMKCGPAERLGGADVLPWPRPG